jgi:hypothetical protein
MGLDVYVGSLTRYYVEGSAEVVERVARQGGRPLGRGALAGRAEPLARRPAGRAAGLGRVGPGALLHRQAGLGRLRRGPARPAGAAAARYRLDERPPEPAAGGHSLSAAAGNGLAVLLRLAGRPVVCRVPMKLDF